MGCGGQSTVFDRAPEDAGSPSPDTAAPPDILLPDLECSRDEECDSKLICCEGVCTVETVCRDGAPCEAQEEPCKISNGLSFESQGEFFCAAIDERGPICLTTCEATFSVSGCPDGSFCLDINGDDGGLRICLPGECTRSSECPGGNTCVPFGNEAGFCFAAGAALQGQGCGGDVRCAADLYCIRSPRGAICQPLCNMWAGDGSECQGDTTCGYLTLGTGVCRAQTNTGRDIEDSCSPQGGWCNPGVQCFDFHTGGESLPVCTAWCRPGHDDCRGRFQNHSGFCRTVFSTGDGQPVTDFGLCL
jgi:hypothetical protein